MAQAASLGPARLFELGFVEAGTWSLQSQFPLVDLNEHRSICPCLYAFVEDDRIVYVGKSTKTLLHRMGQYQKPGPTQRTSKRNHVSIAASLGQKRRVRVFVLKCDAPVMYRGIKVNIAAGLEDPLISLFKPEWNKTGKS